MSYLEFVKSQNKLVGKTVEFTAEYKDGSTQKHQRKVYGKNEFAGTGTNEFFTITNVTILN